MSQFRDQTWETRFSKMGDQAEAAFEDWAQGVVKLGYVRYGLDRPPIQMYRLSAFIRYTPDYLMSQGLVEVQGFGNDQTFKLKHDKLEALVVWSYQAAVHLFAYDSKHDRSWMVPLADIVTSADAADFTEGMFPEGKPYYEIPATWFEQHAETL